jgi:hypothetical protein
VVEFAGVKFLVGGAPGNPEMNPVRPAHLAVHMHAGADHAEGR